METRRWTLASAAAGAVAWLIAPWLPGSPLAFASLEHVFVFMPLVAFPVALELRSQLLERLGRGPRFAVAVRVLQPIASTLLVASFFVEKGPRAAALAAAWLITALVVAAGGLVRARSDPSLLAAHVFLPIGAVWLLLSRLGVGPRTFAPVTVFLAAVHFHYSGFTLQLLVAATRRLLPASALQQAIAIGAIVGIPLIAAGNALQSSGVKLAGVGVMVASTLGLSLTMLRVAPRRGLLWVSALSIAVAMALAVAYAGGWIGIQRMAQVHGLANAVGFTLCGLWGHLDWARRAPLARTTRGCSQAGTPALP